MEHLGIDKYLLRFLQDKSNQVQLLHIASYVTLQLPYYNPGYIRIVGTGSDRQLRIYLRLLNDTGYKRDAAPHKIITRSRYYTYYENGALKAASFNETTGTYEATNLKQEEIAQMYQETLPEGPQITTSNNFWKTGTTTHNESMRQLLTDKEFIEL